MDGMHAYEKIPLFAAGLCLATWLLVSHGLMIAKPTLVQGWLNKLPRSTFAGQILMGLGLMWFWLLVAPPGQGPLHALAMDLGDFNALKPTLRWLVPVSLVAICLSVQDFLAVRALGLLGLLVAAPLLEAAFLKEPISRLLVPIFAYALLTASMFWVGMPYVFRDWVNWASAKSSRWRALGFAGLGYGLAVLVCALAFWRDV